MYFFSYTVSNAISAVLVAIFVFDTRVTGQRTRMIKRGKSFKEKGRERCEIFNNKDGFQNRNEVWPLCTKQNQVWSFWYIVSIKIKYLRFMKYFYCTPAFGIFNCYSTAKAKDLINFPSLQVFALTPDIPVVTTKRNRNKVLTMNI